ncbi:hypothetical protein HYU06_07000 [Candidatus Woesearchaeota archaeon]|nr:hypothetical protein [Candidatus Woesearchaeota archaeon]
MPDDNAVQQIREIIGSKIARKYYRRKNIRDEIDCNRFDLTTLQNPLTGIHGAIKANERVIPVNVSGNFPLLAVVPTTTINATYIGWVSIDDAAGFCFSVMNEVPPDKYGQAIDALEAKLNFDGPPEKTLALIVDEILRATDNLREGDFRKILRNQNMARVDHKYGIMIFTGKRYTDGKTVDAAQLGNVAVLFNPRDASGKITLDGMYEWVAVGITSHLQDELTIKVRYVFERYKLNRYLTSKKVRKAQHSGKLDQAIHLVGGALILSVAALAGIFAARDYINPLFKKDPGSDTYAAKPVENSAPPIKDNNINNAQANPPPIPSLQDEATTRLLDYARSYFTQLSELSHESQGQFTQQILDDIAAQYHRKLEFKGLNDTTLSLLESKLSLANESFQVLGVEILFQGYIGNFMPFYPDYRAKNLGRQPTPEENAAIHKDFDILIRNINPVKSFYAVARARVRSGSGAEKNVDVLFIEQNGYRIVVDESR